MRQPIRRLTAAVRRARDVCFPDRPSGRLDDVGVRIAALGGYQRPVVTRWLYEAFDERGYDTCARVAGPEQKYLIDGYEFRSSDNETGSPAAVLDHVSQFEPKVAIIENDWSANYGLRQGNYRLRPQVVVLPAVGRGFAEEVGRDRRAVVRALSSAIPPETHVISGERNDALFAYLSAELERRDATCSRLLSTGETSPWADAVALVDGTLEYVDGVGLAPELRARFLAERRPAWTDLGDVRVFDATGIPDTESIERLRRSLDGNTPFVPVLCLSSGRYDRIADLLDYLNWLVGWGDIERVHVVDGPVETLARRVSVPIRAHESDSVTPGEVLDAAGRDGDSILLMANTPSSFVDGLRSVYESRAVEPAGESATDVSRYTVAEAIETASPVTQTAAGVGREAVPLEAGSLLLLSSDREPLWRTPAGQGRHVLTVSYFPVPESVGRTGLGDGHHVVTVGGGAVDGFVTVDDQADVDAIADLVDAYLAEWDGGAVIRLDSASALLQAAGPGRGIAVLRTVLEAVEREGATLYVRLDPNTHPESLLSLLRGQFDHTVELDQ